jgi:hypothetical protein
MLDTHAAALEQLGTGKGSTAIRDIIEGVARLAPRV